MEIIIGLFVFGAFFILGLKYGGGKGSRNPEFDSEQESLDRLHRMQNYNYWRDFGKD